MKIIPGENMKFSKLSFLIAAVFAVPFAHAEVIVDTPTTIWSTESVDPAGGGLSSILAPQKIKL